MVYDCGDLVFMTKFAADRIEKFWIIEVQLNLSLLGTYMYIHNTNSSIKPHPGVRGGVFIFRRQEEGLWGEGGIFSNLTVCKFTFWWILPYHN